MGHQVFISYANDKGSRNNRDFQVAETIYNALEAKNIRCWMAPRDIPSGADWLEAILDAVEKSKLVVLVFSSNANQSQWVKDEISMALEKNITIIPFRIENVSPKGRLKVLKLRCQYLEAYTPPLKDHIDKLVKDVQARLGVAPQPPKSQKLIPNPFIDTIAIHDPARFIGREGEMRRLMTLLQGGSVALHGEPKVGKSSLMLHLVRNCGSEVKVIGPLDCMSLEDRDDFYEQIAEALELENSNWRTIRRALNSNRILLLVDELDTGPEQGLTHTDLTRFRAICGSNRNFKMVAVSRIPLKEVFPDTGIGSPAFNFLVPFILGSMTEGEALQLLNHPWAPDLPFFNDETCEQLLELTVFHPYKLQRAAFHRFESLADPAYDWQAGYKQDMEQMV
ncbi:MAG: TIR domain-containing protein [Candidatus Aminicenantes bacterium]|nr:TIR domain-containing protein [Candidatus Aminicenantes bacterium]